MDKNIDKITALYDLPFMDLLYQAHSIHRQNFDPNIIQTSALLSIKTGNCSEDCAYCAQSRHFQTKIDSHGLMPSQKVMAKAKIAKQYGATRFCMSTAWLKPTKKEFPKIIEIIKQVKTLGLETCVTLGKLNDEQVQQLKASGLDYYNHNLESSPKFYSKIVTTHTYQDRLETLHRIAKTDIKICCGGIIGMGESRHDRIDLLAQLTNLPKHPESVPINRLVPIKAIPLEKAPALDDLEFIRTIAVARIMLPKSYIRLAAGRATMIDIMQACCFFAGANSIFYGNKLLTTANPEIAKDLDLFERLGIKHA